MKTFLFVSPDGSEFIGSKGNDIRNIIYNSLSDTEIYEEYWFSGTNTAELICYDNKEMYSLLLISVGDYGIFLHFSDEKENKVSLHDAGKMNEIYENIESLGVAVGLYIPAESAWTAIDEFLETGSATDKINWISVHDMDKYYPDAEYI